MENPRLPLASLVKKMELFSTSSIARYLLFETCTKNFLFTLLPRTVLIEIDGNRAQKRRSLNANIQPIHYIHNNNTTCVSPSDTKGVSIKVLNMITRSLAMDGPPTQHLGTPRYMYTHTSGCSTVPPLITLLSLRSSAVSREQIAQRSAQASRAQ